MTSFLVFMAIIFTLDLVSKLDRFRTGNFTIDPTVMTLETVTSIIVLVCVAVLMVRGVA